MMLPLLETILSEFGRRSNRHADVHCRMKPELGPATAIGH